MNYQKIRILEPIMNNKRGLFITLFLCTVLLAASTATAKKMYTFKGTLNVELTDVKYTGNQVKPLKRVQLRVVREKSPTKGAVGKHTVTNEYGEFQINRKFAKDRNGILPGGKNLRFLIQARFRNPKLKVRKGGWLKNNWFTIAKEQGKGGGNFNLKTLTFNRNSEKHDLNNDLAGKHAQIWWVYTRMLNKLQKNHVPLQKRITVIYPDKHVYGIGSDRSWFLHKVHLDKTLFNDKPEWCTNTMIHELMHQWDIEHMTGEKSLNCLIAVHHKSPKKPLSSRCAGFMEGFAEAFTLKFSNMYFGGKKFEPLSHKTLRNGNFPYIPQYNITNKNEAERSDIGWLNFFTFLWTQNESPHIGGAAPTSTCNLTDVSVYEVLRMLRDERPTKAKWLVIAPAKFKWFTDMLQQRFQQFDSTDAKGYQLLGDPSLSAKQVYAQTCPGTGSSKQPITSASIDFTGTWNTNFGKLDLYQIKNYVIGDYADDGVILGKLNGNCLTGVFTNAERNGVFRFKANGKNNFKGQWAWHGETPSGNWNGSRSDREVRQLDNFTRGSSTTQVIDNNRKVYDGIYNSSFGKVELFSRDLFLIGDYGNKGIIAGMWDGNSFVGKFTNGDRTGWFYFEFFSRNGEFRDGSWGWIASNNNGDWSLNKSKNQTPNIDNMTDDVSCR